MTISTKMWAIVLLFLTTAVSCWSDRDKRHNFLDNLPPYRPPPPQDRSQDSGSKALPSIDTVTPTNLTFVKGKTALMICVVRNLGNASVSWLRHRDISLLGLNEITNSKDKRIKVIHTPGSAEWVLRITDVQPKDAGIYECQLTTPEPTSKIVTLNVLDPVTEILGPDEVYMDLGSTLNLTCVITGGPRKQSFIMWNHNNKAQESPRILWYSNSALNLTVDSSGRVISSVVIVNTQQQHSGNYTCEPGEGPPKKVRVHILTGGRESPVSGSPNNYSFLQGLFWLTVSCCVLDKFLVI